MWAYQGMNSFKMCEQKESKSPMWQGGWGGKKLFSRMAEPELLAALEAEPLEGPDAVAGAPRSRSCGKFGTLLFCKCVPNYLTVLNNRTRFLLCGCNPAPDTRNLCPKPETRNHAS